MRIYDCLKHRNEIYGLAAVWIVLFHVYNYVGLAEGGILGAILSIGNLGVDVFLFLSAVGLEYSIRHNTTARFYKRRFVRTVLPYLIAAAVFFIWYDFLFYKDGVAQYLLNVTTLQYWLTGKHPVWYMAFIMIVYAVYPFLHSIDVKTKHLGILAMIFASVTAEVLMMKANWVLYTNCERALSRIPIFLIGMLAGPVFRKEIKVTVPLFCLAVGLGGLLTYSVFRMMSISILFVRYVYGIIGICLILCYSWLMEKLKLRPIIQALSYLGDISLEIYIVHVFLLQIIKLNELWGRLPFWTWYFIVLVIGIIGGKLLQTSIGKITSADAAKRWLSVE